jgi:protein TonB
MEAEAPAPGTPDRDAWNDPAEQTPAHGILMRQLAQEMTEEYSLAAPDQPAKSPAAPPASERVVEDESWDDETPANRWIAAAEEEAASEKPRISTIRRVAAAQPLVAPAPLRAPVAPARQPELRAPAIAAPVPDALRADDTRRKRILFGAGAALLVVAVVAFVLLRRGSSEHGALVIRSHPTGAEVFVRGERVGVTPLSLERLKAGPATLELRVSGYEPVKRSIELRQGTPVSLDIDLLRRPPPAQPAPPPTVSATEPALLEGDPEASEANEGDTPERRASRRRRSEGGSAQLPAAAPADSARAIPAAELNAEPPAEPQQAAAPDPSSVLRVSPQPNEAAPPPPGATTPAGVALALTPPKATAPARPAPAEESRVSRDAVLVDKTTPRFPSRARRLDITEGTVAIEYTVSRDGSVKDPRVVESVPEGLFDKAALEAIQKWKYQPKLENGTPVESRQRMKFRFNE